MAFIDKVETLRRKTEKIETSSVDEKLKKQEVLSNILIAEALNKIATEHWKR